MTLKTIARRILPEPVIAALKAAKLRVQFGGLDHRGVFEKIHAQNLWGDLESISGSGSTLAVTEVFRSELASWLSRNSVQSMVDVPCGDFNWMREVKFPAGMSYLGLEIVEELVAKTRAKHSGRRVDFQVADILSSDLPMADAYLCKDLFIHFPNDAIDAAVKRVLPRTAFLLTTTFPNTRRNEDIPFGGARRTNMTEFLGEPVEMLRDFGNGVTDRYIGVWRGHADITTAAPKT